MVLTYNCDFWLCCCFFGFILLFFCCLCEFSCDLDSSCVYWWLVLTLCWGLRLFDFCCGCDSRLSVVNLTCGFVCMLERVYCWNLRWGVLCFSFCMVGTLIYVCVRCLDFIGFSLSCLVYYGKCVYVYYLFGLECCLLWFSFNLMVCVIFWLLCLFWVLSGFCFDIVCLWLLFYDSLLTDFYFLWVVVVNFTFDLIVVYLFFGWFVFCLLYS